MSLDVLTLVLPALCTLSLYLDWTVGEGHQERAVKTGELFRKTGLAVSLSDVAKSLAEGLDAILKTLNCLLCNFSQSGESGLIQAKHAV